MKKSLSALLVLFCLSSYAQDTIRIRLPRGTVMATSDTLWNISGNNIYSNVGSVGIGTTDLSDPNFRLFVEEGIRTRKIKVDQSAWPDFVFNEDYSLLPLDDLEFYLKQHSHLPGIPSANDVKQNGIDLGKNQALLLQKLEELTLYLIEQNKEIEKLQKIIQEQNKKIKEQSDRTTELINKVESSDSTTVQLTNSL